MLSCKRSTGAGCACSAFDVHCCDTTKNVSFHLVCSVIALPCLETAWSIHHEDVAAES